MQVNPVFLREKLRLGVLWETLTNEPKWLICEKALFRSTNSIFIDVIQELATHRGLAGNESDRPFSPPRRTLGGV